MFTRSLDRAGLGPADILPPTLQPQAVLSMAPAASRRLSFLASCVVYLACGFAATGVAKLQPAPKGNPFTRGCREFEVELSPALPPAPAVVAPMPSVRPTPLPRSEEQPLPPPAVEGIPDTPRSLPTEDRGLTGLHPVAQPTGPIGPGAPAGTPQVIGGPGPATSTPLLVSSEQMRVRSQVPPTYPTMARLAKVQGSVVLLMTVDAQGLPVDVQVLQGVHPSLDAESLRVARLWRFEPAQVNGVAVTAQFRLTLNFRLK